jgi:hypothetical protein
MNRPDRYFRAHLAVLITGGALVAALFPMAGSVLAVAPSAPSVPDLAAASDTGNSSTDNITQTVNGLVFTGTAEAASTVKIYVGASTVIGTGTATAGGAYSVTTTGALPNDATNSITATATNGAAEEGVHSAALTVTTDNTAPAAPGTPDLAAASDTGTSSTDNITADTTPTFTGTSEANATVQLFAGATLVGTAIATGTSWSITSSALGSGVHSMTAVQIDAAGNGPSVASSALSVTIDTAVPAAPSAPDLTTASDTGASSTDNITSDTTPTFTGTAEAGSTVTLFAGATQVGTATATAGSWTITTGILAAGTYSFTATATNLAGTGVASSALSVMILGALGVTINQAAAQADPTATSPINFTVVFTSAVTGFATGDVTITGTAGGSKAATVTGTGTTYNVAVTGMTGAGTVVATVAAGVATDLVANTNTVSTSTDNSVTWDPTAGPTVTINQASGQADPTSTTPINFTVVFSDSVTGSFDGTDITLAGTAGATTAVVTGGGRNYNVAVSGMTSGGTVIATIAADRAVSVSGGHPSQASTSTDNTVTFLLGNKFLVTSNSYTPVPGTAVTITAQLATLTGTAVPTSGLVVTWSSTNGGTFSAATSTTNSSGIATITFTVSSTNGTVHTVTATSGAFTGTSSNITVAANPATISLTRSHGMITYGEPDTFSVQFGTGGAYRPFILEYTSVGVPWTTIANLTTNAAGFASFAYTPTRTGYVRARFLGTTDLGAATSTVYIVGVRQTVSTLSPHHAGTKAIAAGTSITFATTVRPTRPDLAPSMVTFRFYQKVSGAWVLKAERGVVTGSSGVASATFRFGSKGTWYVRAYAPRTPYNSISRYTAREYYLVQ